MAAAMGPIVQGPAMTGHWHRGAGPEGGKPMDRWTAQDPFFAHNFCDRALRPDWVVEVAPPFKVDCPVAGP